MKTTWSLLIGCLFGIIPISIAQTSGTKQASGAKSIDWEASYLGETFANLRGGRQTGANYLGVLNLAAEYSLKDLIKWRGGRLILNVMNIHGSSISELIGDDLLASNIDAQPSTRLQNLFLQQELLDSTLILRVGKQAIDEEFLTTEFSNLFLHMAAAYPFTLSFNAAPWPAAALGITSSWHLHKKWTFHAGFLNADPNIPDETINRTGLKTYLRPSGYLLIAEASHHMERSFARLGVMHDTNPYQDRFGTTHQGMTALYLTADVPLIDLKSGQAGTIALFATVSSALQWNIAPIDLDIRGALVWTKLHDKLKKSQLGLGYFFPRVGDAAQTEPTLPIRTEQFTEITYRLSCTDHIEIQSSLQYIIHPGGASGHTIPSAWVAAFRLGITL